MQLRVGEQSVAWLASLRISGISAAYGFGLVTKGDYVMYLGFGGLAPLDTPTSEGFIDQALAKVP